MQITFAYILHLWIPFGWTNLSKLKSLRTNPCVKIWEIRRTFWDQGAKISRLWSHSAFDNQLQLSWQWNRPWRRSIVRWFLLCFWQVVSPLWTAKDPEKSHGSVRRSLFHFAVTWVTTPPECPICWVTIRRKKPNRRSYSLFPWLNAIVPLLIWSSSCVRRIFQCVPTWWMWKSLHVAHCANTCATNAFPFWKNSAFRGRWT